jgi:GxxExxY protein
VDSEDRITYRILDAARVVHSTLGPGFVESIYGRALTAELKNEGFHVDRERAIKIGYGAALVGKHRLGLVVDQSVIIELKVSRSLISASQCSELSPTFTLRTRFGLLLNFGTAELQWECMRAEGTS